MRIAALALGLVIMAGACASSGTAAGDQSATAPGRRRRARTSSRRRKSATARRRISPNLSDSSVQAGLATNQVNVVVNNDIMNLSAGEGTRMLRTSRKHRERNPLSHKIRSAEPWGARVELQVIQVITR